MAVDSLKIRGLDPVVIKKYDTLAHKVKMSRENYLRNLLTVHAVNELFAEKENEYQKFIGKMITALDENTKAFKLIASILEGDSHEQDSKVIPYETKRH